MNRAISRAATSLHNSVTQRHSLSFEIVSLPPCADPIAHPIILHTAARPRRGRVAAKTIRLRDKEHRKFVASQPCIACSRTSSDSRHIRFAQPRALGRKVSDEHTVPVCRVPHRELPHRELHG